LTLQLPLFELESLELLVLFGLSPDVLKGTLVVVDVGESIFTLLLDDEEV
jgi:hypothetical protein